jgi:tRNA(Arg) A34 adenosine deaminase TadA/beta-phosphoglucomutase-like phosphatase (HAD superfamily)
MPHAPGGLQRLLGNRAAAEHGPWLRKAASQAFASVCETERVRVSPGAVDLLVRLRDLGIRIAVASVGSGRELHTALASCGLHLGRLTDCVVTADDARGTAETVAAVAAGGLRLHPAQCVWVSGCEPELDDALRAGMASVAVGPQRGLVNCDAIPRACYPDILALLSDWEPFLLASSPVAVHVTGPMLEGLMRSALAAATAGLDAGEIPFGTAVADQHGQVFAKAHQRVRGDQNMVQHSLLRALREAGQQGNLLVASTLEPCAMCLHAAAEAGVETLAFGVGTPGRRLAAGASRGRATVQPRVAGGILAHECRSLLRAWLRRNGGYRTEHHAWVERLLAA